MPAPLPALAGSIVLKAVADLPARLLGGNAQQVQVTGLDYTLHLDISKLPETEATTVGDQWAPIWNESTGNYERLNLGKMPSDVTAEQIDDRVAELLQAGDNITLTYDDSAGALVVAGARPGNIFDTKADAEAATMPATTKMLALGGYATPGDACQVLTCKRVNAMPTLHDGYIRTLDRFKANGIEDAANGGYWEYVIPSEGIRIEWFGGKSDTFNTIGTDNTPAYERAKKCVTNRFNSTTYRYYKGGPTILFGFSSVPVTDSTSYYVSAYYFSSTVLITDSTVHLKGVAAQGVENNFGYPTQFVFPPDIVGVRIQGYNNLDGAVTDPGGHGSILENIVFSPRSTGTNPNAHGVFMGCKATIRNCQINNFSGHGLHLFGDVNIVAFPGSQASVWRMDNLWCGNNKRSGIRVEGGDANVGLGEHINVIGNGEWGIDDVGFLGSTWSTCHARGNVLGPYRGGGLNQRSLWLGCYSESGQPPANFTKSAIVIGGLHAAGIVGDAVRITDDFITGHRLGYAGSTAGNRLLMHQAEYPNLIFGVSIDDTVGLAPHSSFIFYPPSGVYGWTIGDPGNHIDNFAFSITSEVSNQDFGRGETLGPLKFVLPQGMFLGNDLGISPCKVGYTDKYQHQFYTGFGHVMAPGPYASGDIQLLIQDTNTAKDYVGDYCIQTGVMTADVWTSGTTYNSGARGRTYVKNSAGKFYHCMNDPGTPSTVEPTHASGTATVGGYQWKWIANQPAIFKRFGNLLGAKSTTVNDPLTNLYQTWNAGGVTFQGHVTNIVDTASSAASVIEEWQVNGTRKFAMGKQGGFGFFGATPPTTQPVVTGSRGGNAALASLLTALAATGIIVDGTTV